MANGVGKSACVLFAGTVNCAVREPLLNTSAGSSAGTVASGSNVSERVPVMSAGNGDESVRLILGWDAGSSVLDIPLSMGRGVAGIRTTRLKSIVARLLPLSVT